jgi:hypothetical protein
MVCESGLRLLGYGAAAMAGMLAVISNSIESAFNSGEIIRTYFH